MAHERANPGCGGSWFMVARAPAGLGAPLPVTRSLFMHAATQTLREEFTFHFHAPRFPRHEIRATAITTHSPTRLAGRCASAQARQRVLRSIERRHLVRVAGRGGMG